MKSVTFTKLAVLTATTVLVNSAQANELTLGGFPIIIEADGDEGPYKPGSLLSDTDIRFTDTITLDNGLQFGARIDPEPNVTSASDDIPIAVRGSFGDILLGRGDDTSPFLGVNYYPNSGTGAPWGACGEFEPSKDGIKYITPRFAGVSLGLNYLGSFDEVDQDGLAVEQGGQLAVGYDIGYDLDGIAYGLDINWCVDNGRLLPLQVSLGFEGYELDGSGSVSNMMLPNIGIPGVGDSNGVFINTPVDVWSQTIDVDRNYYGAVLSADLPLYIYIDPGSATRSPRVGSFSLTGGFRYGMDEQHQQSWAALDAPAFGANSRFDVLYDTRIDANRLGVFTGLNQQYSFLGKGGWTNTIQFGGTLGYDYFDISMTDAVWADGLGGALNYQGESKNTSTDGTFNGSLTASYGFSKDNHSIGLSAGLLFNYAAGFNVERPDSTPSGDPAPSKVDLETNTNWTVGLRYSYNF